MKILGECHSISFVAYCLSLETMDKHKHSRLLSFTVCTLRKNLHWSRTNVSGDTGQTNRLSDDGASVVVIYSYFYNICIFLLY